ncbi:MAG: YggS family pyridoxal phosphate-dependent enzyme [Bacteroidia bacterium]
MMPSIFAPMMSIVDNLAAIKVRIEEATASAERPVSSAKLIAVSKTKPMSLIHEAYEAGQRDFGENKVQELTEKHPALPEANWHMIGHLQRNKVKYIAPFIHLIHSVDSERLLAEINKRAAQNERIIDCLLQLNISEEDAKSGLNENTTYELLTRLDDFPNVRIKGLMGMAELTDDQSVVKSQFARLAKAFKRYLTLDHPRIEMEELSMGMSGDFELAIAEGATMLRIGSAVFGSRNYG